MINFSDLPLSPNQSRAARNYLGMSQAQAAEQSGLQAHKLKRFETGNYMPDSQFLQDLRDFFEGLDYDFRDTDAPGANARANGDIFPAGLVGNTDSATNETDSSPSENQGKPQRHAITELHHIRINPALKNDQIDDIFDCIEGNEKSLNALLDRPLSRGFAMFQAVDADSQVVQVAAQRLLAENGLLFALLLGRSPIAVPEGDTIDLVKKAKTHSDLMQAAMADVQRAVVHGDKEAHARRKTRKAPSEVLQALIG